jgi:hypothetical protein
MHRSAAVVAAACAVLAMSGAGASASATTTATATAAARPVTRGTLRPAVHLPRGRVSSPQGIPVEDTTNWSGYVATPKTGHSAKFRHVAASYSVPSVNCAATRYAFSYHWVGLDGWTDSTVEQDGIGSFCVSGSPVYFAWYEMFPAANVFEFYVKPGDAITSDVGVSGTTYTLKLTDQTTGQGFDVAETCAAGCHDSSAEVITEGYTSAPYQGTADFAEEHYDTARVTNGGGTAGGLTDSDWNTVEPVALGATTGDMDTQPGPLYAATSPAQSAFEITWLGED